VINTPPQIVREAEFNPMAGTMSAGSYFAAFDQVRTAHRRFYSTVADGFWVFTRHHDILAAYRKWEDFSSESVTFLTADPPFTWIPEMLDPPEHTSWRRLLKPFFAPRRVAYMQRQIRSRCTEIIDDLAHRNSGDFVTDFARRFPTAVFLDFMGLPVERLDEFLAWQDAIMRLPFVDAGLDATRVGISLQAMAEVQDCFAKLIEERRANPRIGSHDIVSAALSWRIDERPIPIHDVLALCLLLFMAGMDTVSAQLSYIFWHLAGHEADRSRIVDRPGLIPSAVEEFLRVYTVTAPARKVTRDMDFLGCPMQAGDMVWLPLAMANRDPAVFPVADEVIVDRTPNNHIAFGAGPHYCLGAHLARLELRVALEEWHRRIPSYHLSDGAEVPEHGGQTLGIDSLPLTWSSEPLHGMRRRPPG
jgi:cytochrome P450